MFSTCLPNGELMPKHKQFLSAFEWEVMNTIWDLGGKPTVKNVLDYLYPNGEKAYTTVQTIMNILVDKGFLEKEKFGPINLYKPLKRRKNVIKKETKIFMNKVFDGSFQKMAHFMINDRNLTEEEIAYLKNLIESKEKEQAGK